MSKYWSLGFWESHFPRVRCRLTDLRGLSNWAVGGWSVPAAPGAKRHVLRRAHTPGATWIETGTYRGDTTDFLRRQGARVYSIEPDEFLHANSSRRFSHDPKITLIKGSSEEVFSSVVEQVHGPVCFWLDGHYSGPGTYRATVDTPITHELAVVEQNLSRLGPVTVLIDDFREFPSDPAGTGVSRYPSRESLVAWASRNGFAWNVEHDIFIATSNE